MKVTVLLCWKSSPLPSLRLFFYVKTGLKTTSGYLWKDLSLVEKTTLSVLETSRAADFLVWPKVPVRLYVLAGSGLFSLSEGGFLVVVFDWILAEPAVLPASTTSSIYSIEK